MKQHTHTQGENAHALWMCLGRLQEERKHTSLVHDSAAASGKEAGMDQQALDSANLDEVCVCVCVCMNVYSLAAASGKEAGVDQQALDSANLDEVCVCVCVCV